MAAGPTFEPIATQTLASAAATITFSSIAATYTDLRLVLTCTTSSANQLVYCQLNGAGGTAYSNTFLVGFGGSASSSRYTAQAQFVFNQPGNGTSTTVPMFYSMDLFSYAGSTFKTALITANENINTVNDGVYQSVQLYRSTSAITQIDLSLSGGNYAIGTRATLYGIKAA